jgi:hypothetical protein
MAWWRSKKKKKKSLEKVSTPIAIPVVSREEHQTNGHADLSPSGKPPIFPRDRVNSQESKGYYKLNIKK